MFSEHLNKYIQIIECTNTELSAVSGLSVKTIGRYRKGERVPKSCSEQIDKLTAGIVGIAKSKSINLDENNVRGNLNSAIVTEEKISVDYDTFLFNLNRLLDTLEISNASLAKSLKYDASYISRIRAGSRKPGDIFKFSENIAMISEKKVHSEKLTSELSNLLGIESKELDSRLKCSEKIKDWLVSGAKLPSTDHFKKFLESLDGFNLEDYIKIISFDKSSIPTVPFQIPPSKKYSGIEQMMECELDFIKATVTSDSMEDVIIYSEMPMEKLAQDSEFPKKWMYGTALMLKKGLHLNMIHNMNRPFNEMLLGLESWVPMYMTGQISPYYIKETNASGLLNHIKVSGAAALWGDAVAGHFEYGRYCLYSNKEDMQYYRTKAEQLLKTAYPLMEIYNASKTSELSVFMEHSYSLSGKRKKIFGSLPVFTISDELIEIILKRNLISNEIINKIKKFVYYSRGAIEKLLRENEIALIIPKFTREDFEINPPTLFIPELFIERDFKYSYDEYCEHLRQTKAFAELYENCSLKINEYPSFRNINITIIKNKQVIVSKNKSPAIHFVINHPRLIEAFDNFSAPIAD